MATVTETYDGSDKQVTVWHMNAITEIFNKPICAWNILLTSGLRSSPLLPTSMRWLPHNSWHVDDQMPIATKLVSLMCRSPRPVLPLAFRTEGMW